MTRKKNIPTTEANAKPAQQAAAPGAHDEDNAVSRFENDLQELERIVGQMESGNLSLEKSLQLFERGVALGKRCRGSLEKADQRVRELTPDSAVDKDATLSGGDGPAATLDTFDDDIPF